MPVGFVFDLERMGRLRRAPQTLAATLDVPRPQGRERRIRSSDDWRIRGYRTETRVLDGDGRPTSERIRTRAMTVAKDPLSGEMKPTRAVLTIMGWDDVVVYGDETLSKHRPLTSEDAVACGHLTVDGLRAAWRKEHPSTDLARLYYFKLGNHRDPTLYLAYTSSMVAGRQGDYTLNAGRANRDAGAVLTDAEYGPIAMRAKQQDIARRARIAAVYGQGSLAERAARLSR